MAQLPDTLFHYHEFYDFCGRSGLWDPCLGWWKHCPFQPWDGPSQESAYRSGQEAIRDGGKIDGGEEVDRPGLIVFDLNNANAKPLTLIPKLKAKLKKSTSIIGFLSHLQGDLKAKAVEAGCDTVMPRAAFSQNLPNLLRRYGIVQEEEENFNQ